MSSPRSTPGERDHVGVVVVADHKLAERSPEHAVMQNVLRRSLAASAATLGLVEHLGKQVEGAQRPCMLGAEPRWAALRVSLEPQPRSASF